MNNKILIIVFIILCICSTTSAQSDLGLLDHVQKLESTVLIETSDTLTIDKVISPAFSEHFAEIPFKYLAQANETYWFKIDLGAIDLSVTDEWYVSFRYYDKIILYFKNGESIDSISAGLRATKDEGVYDFTDIPFSQDQLINKKYLYATVKNFNNIYHLEAPNLVNSTYIGFLNNYIHISEFKKQIAYYIFIGGISLILSYFIGIYFLYRDYLFIIYSLYLLSLLLYLGVKANMIQDIFRSYAPYFIYFYNSVIQVIVNIFYLLFSAIFLNAKKDFPVLNKFIKWTIYFLIGIIILQTIINIIWPFSGFEEKILIVERYLMIVFSLIAYAHILKNYTQKLVLFFVAGSFLFLGGAALAMFFRNVHFMMYGAAMEVFIFSLGMGFRIKSMEDEKKLMKHELAKIELTALRAQMNPHFIFNSLNSIRAYVISNEIKRASGYISKFSKLIRLILHYSSREFITLKKELDALKLYVDLEELRFRVDFGFELNIEDEISLNDLLLPPLILQPYVENAIRHGLAPKNKNRKLKISIRREKDQLKIEITDNGVGRKYSKSSTNRPREHKSVAMELTKKRINLTDRLLSDEKNIEIIDLKEGDKALGTRIILKLPIRLKNN